MQHIRTFLQVTRLGLMPTAIANIWLVVFLSRLLDPAELGRPADGRMALLPTLLLTAGVAMGLYVFGMTLNDLLDARRDRLLAPGRPIPSGRISSQAALIIAIVALLLGIGCAIPLGPWSAMFALGCAVLILIYDGLAKHIPAIGLLLLGLIRATHMLIAEPTLSFTWPVWVTMTHVILISAVAYTLEGKRPPLHIPNVMLLVIGWIFFSLVLLGSSLMRGTLILPGHPWIWVAPLLTGLVFLVWAGRLIITSEDAKKAGRNVIKFGLLWLILLDTSWLISFQAYRAAAIIGMMLVLALALMKISRLLDTPADRSLKYHG